MKVLRIFRYCFAVFGLFTVIAFLAPYLSEAVGGDVQATKWPVVFYGGLSLLLAGLFAILSLAVQAILALTRKRHQANG